jgi:hypothetical protein
MRNVILFLIFFAFLNPINAQENESFKKIETGNWIDLSYRVLNEDNDEMPFVCVEQMPIFPGGYDALAKFIKDNLKYPPTAIADSISGIVMTKFSIDKNGKVVNVFTMEGVRSDLDSACIKAISIMPDWTRPTFKSNSDNVLIQFILPIHFIIIDNTFKFEPSKSTISGIIVVETFFDANGKKERSFILKLEYPIKVIATPDDILNYTTINVTTVQLTASKINFSTYKNRKVRCTGTFFSAITAHHHTDILMSVETIQIIE